ncbi:MAG: tryptophan synthase subunit alpha [Candidatus Rokubacteria bacterium]|nr:tryptophan synthase subunit alpha [Candidatus Rokubacteria bacterium]
MSRLDAAFSRLRAADERALVAYLMAGDPSLDATRALVVEAARRGADVIELGVPFSDPIADGPVIQRAGQRALAAGTSLARVIESVTAIRAEVSVPLVMFTYYNPVLAFGLKAFASAAADVGMDAVLVPDLPPEEADPLRAETDAAGIDIVHLVAPTTPPARARMVTARSRGFVYVVSLTGVTGERQALPPDLGAQLKALRRITRKPLCVGFGISTAEQAAAVGRHADGVVVGSAIVRLIEHQGTSPSLVKDVGELIASLKQPLRAPSATSAKTSTESPSTGRR